MTNAFRWLQSFRFRMALLATVSAGVVLLLFGFYALWAVERATIARVDNQLENLARSIALRPGPFETWRDLGEALENLLGTATESEVALLVAGHDREVLYRSDHFPKRFAIDTLPLPPDAPFRDELGPPRRGPGARGGTGPRGSRGPGGPGRFVEVGGFQTLHDGPTLWRSGIFVTPGTTVVLGLDLNRASVEARQLRRMLLLGLPVGLLLIGLTGYWLAHRALRPITQLTDTAETITIHDLSARLSEAGSAPEFARLIHVFNDMLERLEQSFQQATRFSADAAHELKTPLAILQGLLERNIQDASPGTPEQERYAALLQEVQRLKALVRRLLLLAQADAGELRPRMEAVDLAELLRDLAEDGVLLGPELHIECDAPESLVVEADPELLRQALQNLMSNAVKYNTPGGRISIAAKIADGVVRIGVRNTGPAISEDAARAIFDRFYRGDASRSAPSESAGLGLSLTREIARAHGGDCYLESSAGGENVFVFALPRP